MLGEGWELNRELIRAIDGMMQHSMPLGPSPAPNATEAAGGIYDIYPSTFAADSPPPPFISELGMLGTAGWDLWAELHSCSLPCVMLSWYTLDSKQASLLGMMAFCTSVCSRDFTLAIQCHPGYADDEEDRMEIRRFFREELPLHRQAAGLITSVHYVEVEC